MTLKEFNEVIETIREYSLIEDYTLHLINIKGAGTKFVDAIKQSISSVKERKLL
jgi:hypothetical protein